MPGRRVGDVVPRTRRHLVADARRADSGKGASPGTDDGDELTGEHAYDRGCSFGPGYRPTPPVERKALATNASHCDDRRSTALRVCLWRRLERHHRQHRATCTRHQSCAGPNGVGDTVPAGLEPGDLVAAVDLTPTNSSSSGFPTGARVWRMLYVSTGVAEA